MLKLILILHCIILVIFFSKLINLEAPKQVTVLGRVGGAIDRNNFSYFYLKNYGPIILNLTSLVGDADLYISTTNMQPTYEPHSYELHSVTCGEDIIEVPESFEPPLAVGVYGSAESSFFILEVLENPNYPPHKYNWVTIEKDLDKIQAKRPNGAPKTKPKRNSNNVPSIFSVLEVLQMIFL